MSIVDRGKRLEETEPSATAIIERLKAAIDISTDAELAALLGCSRTTISNWRSRNTVPLGRLRRLCKERGVPVDYLLSGRLGWEADGLPILDSEVATHLFRLLDRYNFIRLPEVEPGIDPARRAAAEFLALRKQMANLGKKSPQ